jgi:hypothetical protein
VLSGGAAVTPQSTVPEQWGTMLGEPWSYTVLFPDGSTWDYPATDLEHIWER